MNDRSAEYVLPVQGAELRELVIQSRGKLAVLAVSAYGHAHTAIECACQDAARVSFAAAVRMSVRCDDESGATLRARPWPGQRLLLERAVITASTPLTDAEWALERALARLLKRWQVRVGSVELVVSSLARGTARFDAPCFAPPAAIRRQ